MRTVIPVPAGSDFSLHNLPWGVFSPPGGGAPRVGVAIGDHILDMSLVADLGVFDFDATVFYEPVLNPFIALGREVTDGARAQVQGWLTEQQGPLSGRPELFVDRMEATLHLPVAIGDYTDFYSSKEHATNVGKLFRDPDNALLPNWRHLPVAYHGRASSIVVSGTEIVRPHGQVVPPGSALPEFLPSAQLDFELEVGCIIGKDSELGRRVSVAEAEDYIFGLVLFNDWSARDVQRWEYRPLGPFLGKNFASTVSPWVVPLAALEPFRVAGPFQEPEVFSYLQQPGPGSFDLDLEVALRPPGGSETVVTRTNFRHLYWSMAQQIAHHTANGCNLRVGDLLASGTISGPEANGLGSLLELSHGGRHPFTLDDGTQRTFLENGDTVVLRGYGERGEVRVGFGEAGGMVVASVDQPTT